MFTAEIRINGTLITHIYGHNERTIGPGLDEYSYELYQTESRKVINGTVQHARHFGINHLVSLILSDAETKQTKKTHEKHQS